MNTQRFNIFIIVAALVVTLSYSAIAQERFVQDRFAIGFWVDPPMDDRAAERYKEIADANFTLFVGGFGGFDGPKKVKKQLKLCRKNGLVALLDGRGASIEQLPSDATCWGFGIRDEPSAKDFPALRKQVDAVRKAHPGKVGYINLFPNYANEEQLGGVTYDEHVAQFCEVVNPEVLSMDHYPIFKPGKDGRDGYCENLATMRKYALIHDIPFWNFFNSMPYGPHTDPTESQLRWQVYTSIAYGARGVLYFCYYTPRGPEFPKGGAIIGRDDRPTRHLGQAKRINGALKNLGPTLMELSSTHVYRVKPGDVPGEILKGAPIKDLARADHDPDFDYLIGAFKHSDGRRAVMLNNYHFAYTAWPTVTFDADLSAVREIDKDSGEEVPVLDDSPDMEGLQISLDAGEGRLFLLP